MEGGGPPQCYNEIKKPSAYRVNRQVTVNMVFTGKIFHENME